MKKQLTFRIILFVIYLYIYSFYVEKIMSKLPDWIEFPTTLLGFIALIALIIFVIIPITNKL